ncbi:hypothetical protein KY289_008207 [Solanum tuberosum]|nr:hypothetical protein KY289_008207 [Solanum tuberosum]
MVEVEAGLSPHVVTKGKRGKNEGEYIKEENIGVITKTSLKRGAKSSVKESTKLSVSPFTSWNGRANEACIFKRLDMVVINQDLMDVLLAQEIIADIRKRRKPTNVVIKLDMAKAYDKVD